MSEQSSRSRWITVLLVGLPAWLLASAIFGLWFYFHREKKLESEVSHRFTQAVSIENLRDDLRKFVTIIGERNPSSATAAAHLDSASSMIQGTLGPGNTGFEVKLERTSTRWPVIHASVPGSSARPPVWVVASYDSAPGSRGGEANASGLSATLSAARALAARKFPAPVHFAFVPHANDPDSPVADTLSVLHKLISRTGEPASLLCVEAMGADSPLWLTSRDTTAAPLALAADLGKVVGAEVACLGEDFDLASALFESGFPAVRVATRPVLTPDEPDDQVPSAEHTAAAAGRLVALIERCAAR